jgi:EpsD family peptidyl-prolyl cis-trans isomerase
MWPGSRTALWISVSALLAVVLAGCDRGRAGDGQVVARVNGDDISVHQLNFAIRQAPIRASSTDERTALVEKMIDRQLAVQQSLAHKLDRRPDLMLRIEEARRDILAAAYAEEIAGKLDAPGDDAIARYFGEHPALFAERKIYRLREISIPEGSEVMAEVQGRIDRKQSIAEVIAGLRQQPGRFSDQQAVRPAEQLPIEVVDRLGKLRDGETIAFRLPRALVIYEVRSTESAPLSWMAAAPIVKAHLARQQGAAAFKEELARLRATADISRKALGN